MVSLGTRVATETCGQVRVLKFKRTCCEYWICVDLTVIRRAAVISIGGCTRNFGTGCPASPVSAWIVNGGCPGLWTGTTMTCSTVSIQNVAVICKACAFGPAAAGLVKAAGSPRRKAMLSAPPPNSGVAGLVETKIVVVEVMFCDAIWLRRSVLGSVNMACVMVPAAMKRVRSCGIRAVLLVVAVWLGKGNLLLGGAVENGVISTTGIVGFP